jgi:hypothetical protein
MMLPRRSSASPPEPVYAQKTVPIVPTVPTRALGHGIPDSGIPRLIGGKVRAHVRNSRIWNFVAGQERDPGRAAGKDGSPSPASSGWVRPSSSAIGAGPGARKSQERAENASTIAGNTPEVKKSARGRLMVTGAQWGVSWGLWLVHKSLTANDLSRSLGFKASQHCILAPKLRECISLACTQVHRAPSRPSLPHTHLSPYPPSPA